MAVDEQETPIEAFERMLDPAAPPDELDMELEACLEDSPFGQSIRHPLYYSIMHHGRMNGMANAAYRLKKKAVREARAKAEWDTYVWLHERPYRLWAFAMIADQLTDRRYWAMLGAIWTDSENVHECFGDWLAALHSPRKDRWAIMDTVRERDRWRKLRKRRTPVLIYRGFADDDGEHGLSWTLDRERGLWFARRWADEGAARLAVGVCDGENIIAYFDGRGEDEVLILPEHVHIDRILKVEHYAQTKVSP